MATPAGGDPGRSGRPVDLADLVVPAPARAFQAARAGLVSRVLAGTVDAAVVAAVLAGGYLAATALRFCWNSRTFTFPTAPFRLLLVLAGAVAVAYLTGSWAATGRSYGGHLLGLRVVGPRGRLLRTGGALLRAALCTVFPIGLFWVALSRQNRSVQDLLLRTSVVYDWRQLADPAGGRAP